MNDRQDMPTVIPDCAPPVEIRAARIRLWRLFDHIAECKCDADLYTSTEPLALQVLTDWARDRGRSTEAVHHPKSDRGDAFTVYKCNTGMGMISVYMIPSVLAR
jgi:hypothetical protein